MSNIDWASVHILTDLLSVSSGTSFINLDIDLRELEPIILTSGTHNSPSAEEICSTDRSQVWISWSTGQATYYDAETHSYVMLSSEHFSPIGEIIKDGGE